MGEVCPRDGVAVHLGASVARVVASVVSPREAGPFFRCGSWKPRSPFPFPPGSPEKNRIRPDTTEPGATARRSAPVVPDRFGRSRSGAASAEPRRRRAAGSSPGLPSRPGSWLWRCGGRPRLARRCVRLVVRPARRRLGVVVRWRCRVLRLGPGGSPRRATRRAARRRGRARCGGWSCARCRRARRRRGRSGRGAGGWRRRGRRVVCRRARAKATVRPDVRPRAARRAGAARAPSSVLVVGSSSCSRVVRLVM